MRQPVMLLISILIFGCVQQSQSEIKEENISKDLGVAIIIGENHSLGDPIAFQLKTTNFSITYLNRSGGYSIGHYPSVWICRKINESCTNIEYRQMREFSKCISGVLDIHVPSEGIDKKEVWPAETQSLLFTWDQMEWHEEKVPCGDSFSQIRKKEQVPPGNYSITFVYWVNWSKEPMSISTDFRII